MKIQIEPYTKKKTKNTDRFKEDPGFRFEPLPWKWSIVDGKDTITYGYCHTEKQAQDMASKELKDRTKGGEPINWNQELYIAKQSLYKNKAHIESTYRGTSSHKANSWQRKSKPNGNRIS